MLILKTLFLLLPAYFANMAPIWARNKFRFLNIPVDFNRKISGQPIFGRSKTLRGFLAGIAAAIIVVKIQEALFRFNFIKEISLIDYGKENFLFLGFLFGFGALFGDLMKSFFKRRFEIAPGKSVKIIDQVDYVIGSLIFVSIVYLPPISIIVSALVISLFLTVLVNHLAHIFRLRDEKW